MTRLLMQISTIRLYSAIHVGSHWKIQDRRHIKNTDNTETKHNLEKAYNAKHSYPGLIASYDTWPGNEVKSSNSCSPCCSSPLLSAFTDLPRSMSLVKYLALLIISLSGGQQKTATMKFYRFSESHKYDNYKKAQLSLTNPRNVKACQNCSNSTCLQRCR